MIINKVFLGFDFGMRHIGVAIGQTVTHTAAPLKILYAKSGQPVWGEIDKLIRNWKPDAIIVGVPKTLEGGVFECITAAAETFINMLKTRYKLPVFAADERLTTKAARELIYEKGGYKALKKAPVDSMAARLILEGWMNENDAKRT